MVMVKICSNSSDDNSDTKEVDTDVLLPEPENIGSSSCSMTRKRSFVDTMTFFGFVVRIVIAMIIIFKFLKALQTVR